MICVNGNSSGRETTDQSASRLTDDVITSTNEEHLKWDQPSWKLWSQIWEHYTVIKSRVVKCCMTDFKEVCEYRSDS